MQGQPYIITVSSEKGGVGKTTLSTNLAVFLKAIQEDLPVTIFSFDNHFSVDRMFRIGDGTPEHSVEGIFTDTPLDQLVELGQYGVNYIPSSDRLQHLKGSISSPATLAGKIAASSLDGILIIDTRPDLEILTQNALYAANRVLIPVKDLPSLENCRHIYSFFRNHNLSRRPLRVVPSLIEARVKYEGAFRNQLDLIKAFAMNRGYRCVEGHITKSPKVDALNTNPEGIIYPILTHGKGTEAYQQYVQLAAEVFRDYLNDQRQRDEDTPANPNRPLTDFSERCRTLNNGCLGCGLPYREAGQRGDLFYTRSLQGRHGFLDEECLVDRLLPLFYQEGKDGSLGWREFLLETTRQNLLVMELRRVAPYCLLHRFDLQGEMVASRPILPGSLNNELLTKFLRPFAAREDAPATDYLMIRRTNPDFPESILVDEAHRAFITLGDRATARLRQAA